MRHTSIYSPILLEKVNLKFDGRQNLGQLERAKTIKVGNIRWPPDKSTDMSSARQSAIDEVRRNLLTIERTKFPDAHNQSQFMTAAKIAAAQQELMLKIGPKRSSSKGATERLSLDKHSAPLTKTTEQLQHKKLDAVNSLDKQSQPTMHSDETPSAPTCFKQNETNMLLYSHFPCLTYLQPSNKLVVRKEFFHPQEVTSDAMIDIIYQQIVAESCTPRNIRLRPKDRRKLEKLIASARATDSMIVQAKRKAEIVDYVRDNCPFYFMKFYPLSVKSGDIEFVGISQKQVILGKTLVATDEEPSFQAIHVFPLTSIIEITCEGNMLALSTLNTSNHFLQTPYSEIIVNLVKTLSIEAADSCKATPLTLPSAEKRKNSASSKKEEAASGRKSKTTHVAREKTLMAPSTNDDRSHSHAANTPLRDVSLERKVPSKKAKASAGKVVEMEVRHSDFAEYFHKKDETVEKQGFLNPLKLVASKAVSLPDVTKLRKKTSQLRWSASPLKQPISTFKDVKLAKLAMNCHVYILSFMGDYSVGKHIRQKELVVNVLNAGLEYKQLQDEIYCQLIMQTNLNKSANAQSCLLGWRLFTLVSTYFPCTEVLQPYVFKYLQNCSNAKVANHDHSSLASLCLQVKLGITIF